MVVITQTESFDTFTMFLASWQACVSWKGKELVFEEGKLELWILATCYNITVVFCTVKSFLMGYKLYSGWRGWYDHDDNVYRDIDNVGHDNGKQDDT